MNTRVIAARFLTPGLRKFSNIHKGESCYVFGDGPSIKWFDLARFSDHPGICCGMIPFHNDFAKLNVEYLNFATPWIFAPKVIQPKAYHKHRAIVDEYERFIKRTPNKEFFIHLTSALLMSGRNIHYVFRGLPRMSNRIDELLSDYDVFGGAFYASIALAYYLGFTTVYLVGFDAWTIEPVRNMRWYEFGEGAIVQRTVTPDPVLEILKEEIDIWSISLDGRSSRVKSVSYQSYTGQPPVFRENYELMSEARLRILAENPAYVIYPPNSPPSR